MTGTSDRKRQIENPKKYALWRERGQEAAHLLAPAVRPIFAFNEAGTPERVGSCVLFSAGGLYFAFSAAHVADLTVASSRLSRPDAIASRPLTLSAVLVPGQSGGGLVLLDSEPD